MSLPRLEQHGAALLRISLGTMWISHALLKFFIFSIAGFAGFLTSQGMPAFMAWPVFLAELIGGALIVLGVHGRYVSLALVPVLIGATAAHLGNGWVFSNPNGGWEYPVFLLVASIAHFLLGDGSFAAVSNQASPAAARLRTA